LIHFYKRNMGDVAASVLAAAAEQDKQYSSILVEKPLELELDLGNLLAVDNNQLETNKLNDRVEREEYLQELARDNTQILINAIWGLPTEKVEEVVVAKFPPPTHRLPREKPVPVPRELTKWEKYAKDKGITNKKKKDRLVWDDIVNKWVPQFGFKKKQAEQEKNWCIPIKETADPNLNPFEKMEEEKQERKAKNELQRLRNVARLKNVKVPTVGVVTPSVAGTGGKSVGFSDELKNAAELVKSSTASLGKFQPDLAKKMEKTAKTKGKKRQFESNTAPADREKERNLGILESITNKQAKLDIGAGITANRKEKRDNDDDDDDHTKKGKGKAMKGKKGAKGAKGAKGNLGSKGKGKGGGDLGGKGKGKGGGGRGGKARSLGKKGRTWI